MTVNEIRMNVVKALDGKEEGLATSELGFVFFPSVSGHWKAYYAQT